MPVSAGLRLLLEVRAADTHTIKLVEVTLIGPQWRIDGRCDPSPLFRFVTFPSKPLLADRSHGSHNNYHSSSHGLV